MAAPPPPPPPEKHLSKISPIVKKLRSVTPTVYQPPKPSIELSPAPTGPYFFYGTLTDSSMVSEILNLDTEPILRPATIVGYKCKMWGQYPALLPTITDTVVEGSVYLVRGREDGRKLADYETSNYHPVPCRILYTDGREPAQDWGHTFQFVGNADDLSEGEFDLQVWLRRMGRQAALERLDARKHLK
ncbi:hypothetical protein EYZ11_003386 [Aspergillus tanneri]|uniref:Putative gamma-glutamylcyclotransferase n=1 Tax=Aspergillus tanneri TaxID=1220188 RepID=A0A4S3JNF0_9EURO|nr:uncharacterized protein ATNIH1004_010444 [Aspergillus tanneri]KAA8643670.1 hypothetical protein ATNIH1004_010444 [Aspergillus tanneri]THC97123.1 hypothetical protein EYZ11_003386 [Aspergillus tanneri]